MPYRLLNGVRVLEVAWLAGDAVGQHLADLGAEVIKVERPGDGDYVRTVGAFSLGGDEGLSFMHLHFNRGKKSVVLDLKGEEGRDLFLALVKRSDIVVEGLRAGAMERWNLGYEDLRKVNPAIVFCTLSGMGRTGPYKDLGTHGFLYDAYTGLAPPVNREGDDIPRAPTERGGLLEYNTGGLYATIGVLAALVRARETGEGAYIDVAQTEALALIRSEKLEVFLNRDKWVRRKSYGPGEGFAESTRASYYTTADDKVIFLQAIEDKFWRNFCVGVGRPDLYERYPSRLDYDHDPGNEPLRRELQQIFGTKDLAAWVEVFIDKDIPGGPVYDLTDVLADPQFQARGNVQDVEYPGLGTLHLTTTPIRVVGEDFAIPLAPELGQDTDEVLAWLAAGEDDPS
jgi:crotonobetainyl-CoA:carnitine CoA-transferase CaiB-like acyl-CoA transferase